MFELFRAPRTGDFSAARFYGYRGVQKPTGQVLARFDDGTPALMESKRAKSGAGPRAAVDAPRWTWNGTIWPVKPVFLPFVHTVTKYLADFTEPPASLTVGQVIPAPRRAAGKGAAVVARRNDRRGPLRRPRRG